MVPTTAAGHPFPRRVTLVPARIVRTADVDDRATIGDGTSVWHLAQVREGAVLGRGLHRRPRRLHRHRRRGWADNCKVQNYALVYEPAVLEDGVFVGPAVVFTNDHFPRSVAPGRHAQARATTGSPSA